MIRRLLILRSTAWAKPGQKTRQGYNGPVPISSPFKDDLYSHAGDDFRASLFRIHHHNFRSTRIVGSGSFTALCLTPVRGIINLSA